MNFRGQVRNGVVVFDDGPTPLAEGTHVRVQPDIPLPASPMGTPGESLLRFRGLIDAESLEQMSRAIEDCDKVDPSEW